MRTCERKYFVNSDIHPYSVCIDAAAELDKSYKIKYIEILSPSTAYYDLGRKYMVYEKAGVKEYWLIHPDRKAVDVYINSGEKFQLSHTAEESGIVKSKLLGGFTAKLEDIF